MKKLLPLPLIFILLIGEINCKKESTNTKELNMLNVGASAHDLLSAGKYPSLQIEIQYMQGYQLDPATINNLTSFLKNLLNKSISISQSAIPSAGKGVLSLSDISGIEKTHRTAYNSSNQIAVYILVIDGAYTDPNVLGIAYQNTSICLMGKTIHDNSGGIGQTSRVKLESTVSEHEMGHLLGLVNIGSPMQTNHIDSSHGNHCINTNCLMYYASETTDILGFLITGSVPTLDANCLADLHANGSR